MTVENRFYVYAHLDADGMIRYVGKGSRKRAWDFIRRSQTWCKTFPVSPDVVILVDGMTNGEALRFEGRCIREFRSVGYALVNIAAVGRDDCAGKKRDNGLRGRVMPLEQRRKIGDANKGCVRTAEQRAHFSAVMRAKKLTSPRAKPVICLETGAVYRCAKEAAKAIGGNEKNVQDVCGGRKKSHLGLHWSYASMPNTIHTAATSSDASRTKGAAS